MTILTSHLLQVPLLHPLLPGSTPAMSSAPLGSVLTRMLLCLHPLLFGPAHSPLACQGLGPHLLVPPLPHHRVPGAACLQGPAPPCPRGRGAQRGPCHRCSTGQPDAWVLLAPSWREWGAAALLVPPASISVNPGSESLGGHSNISQHLRLRNRSFQGILVATRGLTRVPRGSRV